jgi:hypothetical protein
MSDIDLGKHELDLGAGHYHQRVLAGARIQCEGDGLHLATVEGADDRLALVQHPVAQGRDRGVMNESHRQALPGAVASADRHPITDFPDHFRPLSSLDAMWRVRFCTMVPI